MWPTSRLIRVPRLDCGVCHPASAGTLQCSLTFGLQSGRANQTAAALIGQWCEQTNQWESPDTTKLSVPTNTLTYDDSTRGRHRGYRAHSWADWAPSSNALWAVESIKDLMWVEPFLCLCVCVGGCKMCKFSCCSGVKHFQNLGSDKM